MLSHAPLASTTTSHPRAGLTRFGRFDKPYTQQRRLIHVHSGRKPTLFALLTLLLVGFAGCLDADVPPSVAPAERAPPAAPYTPNQWLLDGPRPLHSSHVSGGAEPSILADKDGEYIWIADTTGAYYSKDNGTSWSKMPYFPLTFAFVDGWALAQDDDGVLYAAALTGPEIEFAASSDGERWDYITRAAQVSGTTDRPWLAARGSGEVAMIYFDAPLVATGLYEACARSTDGGRTWVDGRRFGALPQAGNLIYTDDGAFHYVEDRGTMYSYNGGTCLAGAAATGAPFELGANNMIQIATDGTRIYGAAATSGNNAIAVWGTTATGAVRKLTVSPDNLKSNTFATISYHEGELAVAWYGSETAGDPSDPNYDGAFNVYLAKVTDFWGEAGDPVIEHLRVTDEPNHVGDICMSGIGCSQNSNADRDLLDYFMLDHDKWGGVHVAYVHDGTGSNAQVRYAHVPPGGLVQTETGGPGSPVVQLQYQVNRFELWASAAGTYDPEGDAVFYAWDMGDGTVVQGETARHTYSQMGRYNLTLTARDTQGNAVVVARELIVDGFEENRPPQVTIDDAPAQVQTGQGVTFVQSSHDPDGPVVGWSWDLGDGTTVEGPQATHTYRTPGNYTVRVTAEDVWGEVGFAEHAIRAVGPVVATPEEDEEAPGVAALWLLAALGVMARRAGRFSR